jgi:hypothetical protein
MKRLVAVACLLVASAAVQATPEKCIRVFDATVYSHKPNLARLGIEPANVFEPDRYWPRGPAGDDLPDPSAAQEWLHRLRTKHGLLILDVERWWLRGSDADVREAMRRYLTVFDWIRAAGYTEAMGYYGAIPTYHLEAALQDAASAVRAVWRQENDRIQPLADRVDILFPSLYAADSDIESWEKRAIATLQEARRLAKGKPVYPFLWPQYEGVKNPIGLQYMPGSQWARELEIAGNNSNGLVIWGGIAPPGTEDPPRWNESAPWWQATLEFLAHQHLCSSER